MRKVLQWLTSPAVAPLVGRLLLVALTALLVDPPVAVALGAGLEAGVREAVLKP